MLWTLEASYFYYAHGPLARIETGQHNIQGTDYFYTLQGWIKGVNSIGLDADRDLGQDGAQQSTFNKDEYAYALNYYDGDYEARGGTDLLGETFYTNEKYSLFTGYQDKVGGVAYNRESLYNGNIAAMATSIRNLGEEHATQSMNYRYDQLHRIAAAHATKWYEGTWTTTAGSYNTSYDYDKNGNIQTLYRNDRDAVTIDDLSYRYDPIKKNRLNTVKDGGTAEGLNNVNPYEYNYDKIGNLINNEEDGIKDIEWNIYGKVEQVTKMPDPFGIEVTIDYRYDGTGNRIMKKVTTGATSTITTYLRDASGNVMAIYEEKTNQTLAIKEIPIYGSSRLGQYRPKTDTKKTALGQRIYEFSNHLGNVLVTLTDHKVPQTDGTYSSVVLSASDYYPFGMAMKERSFQNAEYRFGFQGQERDEETGTDHYTYRQADPIIGRFWSVDPLTSKYPYWSPYQFSGNMVISTRELEGLEPGPTSPRTGQNESQVHYQFVTNPNWTGTNYSREGRYERIVPEGTPVTKGMTDVEVYRIAFLRVVGEGLYVITNDKYVDERLQEAEKTLEYYMNHPLPVYFNKKRSSYDKNAETIRNLVTDGLFSEDIEKSSQAVEQIERSKSILWRFAISDIAYLVPTRWLNSYLRGAINYSGVAYEKFLINKLNGKAGGTMYVNGPGTTSRDIDVVVGNWYIEAKTGEYWNLLMSNSKKYDKFQSDMGRGLKVIEGASGGKGSYHIFSNSKIPDKIKKWLDKQGIKYHETLK